MHRPHAVKFLALTIAVLLPLSSCLGAPKVRTNVRPDAAIAPSERIAVVPSKLGASSDLILPDALATELIGYGFNIVERTTLTQMVNEAGLDFTEIVNGQEYFKLGTVIQLDSVLLVTAQMSDSAVSNASVRLVRLSDGTIVMSATYSQPQPNNVAYAFHDTIIDSAARLAEAVAEAANLQLADSK